MLYIIPPCIRCYKVIYEPGPGVVAQQVKLPLALPSYHNGAPKRVQITPLPLQLCANVPRKAVDDGVSIWASVIRVGEPERVLGFWLQPGPSMAVEAICTGVSLSFSLTLSHSLCLFFSRSPCFSNNALRKSMANE